MSYSARTCIITGANSGIGRQAAIQLAQKGLQVILACRNLERGQSALEAVQKESGSDRVELMQVDMSLQSSVRGFAAAFAEKYKVLDVLIHNAAFFDISQKKRSVTSEGVETTLATNHVGPVLLTESLLPLIQKSPEGRILFVSSKGLMMYPRLRVDCRDPEFITRPYSVQKAYYQSKLAQVAYMLLLADELKETPIKVNGIRVTNVKVDVSRYPDISPFMRWLYSVKSRFSITPAKMAECYTWLATAADVTPATGGYFDAPGVAVQPNRAALDPDHQVAVRQMAHNLIIAP